MDEKGGDFLTEPDNLRIDEAEMVIYAQAMNHVSDKKTSVPDEYAMQTQVPHQKPNLDIDNNYYRLIFMMRRRKGS